MGELGWIPTAVKMSQDGSPRAIGLDRWSSPEHINNQPTLRWAPTETTFNHLISQLPGKNGGVCDVLFVTGLLWL